MEREVGGLVDGEVDVKRIGMSGGRREEVAREI